MVSMRKMRGLVSEFVGGAEVVGAAGSSEPDEEDFFRGGKRIF